MGHDIDGIDQLNIMNSLSDKLNSANWTQEGDNKILHIVKLATNSVGPLFYSKSSQLIDRIVKKVNVSKSKPIYEYLILIKASKFLILSKPFRTLMIEQTLNLFDIINALFGSIINLQYISILEKNNNEMICDLLLLAQHIAIKKLPKSASLLSNMITFIN